MKYIGHDVESDKSGTHLYILMEYMPKVVQKITVCKKWTYMDFCKLSYILEMDMGFFKPFQAWFANFQILFCSIFCY